jgi:hypothetical protein
MLSIEIFGIYEQFNLKKTCFEGLKILYYLLANIGFTRLKLGQ